MSAITDAFLQNESSKKERENIKIEIHRSLLLLTCENEINFVFGSYESTTNIALSRDFLLAIISPGVPPVFPPTPRTLFLCAGAVCPWSFSGFFSFVPDCAPAFGYRRHDVTMSNAYC